MAILNIQRHTFPASLHHLKVSLFVALVWASQRSGYRNTLVLCQNPQRRELRCPEVGKIHLVVQTLEKNYKKPCSLYVTPNGGVSITFI
jgi:hypothetical protein